MIKGLDRITAIIEVNLDVPNGQQYRQPFLDKIKVYLDYRYIFFFLFYSIMVGLEHIF